MYNVFIMERIKQTNDSQTPEKVFSPENKVVESLERTKEKYETELGKLDQGVSFDEVWVSTYLDALDGMAKDVEGPTRSSDDARREINERRALLLDGLVKAGYMNEEGGLTTSK